MNKAIIGKKLGMSQVFQSDGTVIPVTVVEAGPCVVLQKKTVEIDGYSAIQLGFGDKRESLFNKPILGHCKKANSKGKKYLKEFKLDNAESYEVGSEVKCDIFKEGDAVDVTGITKGRGYAGNIERHNRHRMFETHGTGPCVRQSGSMGANSTPSHVLKGKEMPGHLGVVQVTIINLKIIKIDTARNLLLVKGAIPGATGSTVYVKSAVKTQRVIKPQKTKASK